MSQTIFWAIGDTHLNISRPRDLSRFGPAWHHHAERLQADWTAKVKAEDVVLLLGDIIWTSSSSQARQSLLWLSRLPGRKVMIRGNHDRWWANVDYVRRSLLPPHFQVLQGNAITVDGVLLAGAQGHYAPHDPLYKPDPPHNRYERELATLQAAVRAVQKQRQSGQPLIFMLHYPPYTSDGQATAYSDLIESQAPAACLYGHLHRPEEWAVAVQEPRNGVSYRLLAADYVGMQLQTLDLEGP